MSAAPGGVDVLIVSLGSTAGLRSADAELAASLQRAGARVAVAVAESRPDVRTLALTDLGWARAARRAAGAALAREQPRAVLYSTVTAALLWPRPGAVRFDAPAAGNRPGHHGLWQRPLERRRLASAPLLVPWSAGGLAEAGGVVADRPVVVVPVPVVPLGPSFAGEHAGGPRDIAAISYSANPYKKGIDRVLAAWARVRREGEELVLAGAELTLRADGVRPVGELPSAEYRALLRRARAFVCAPRREDYGLAQLEALDEGCALVTTPSPGPYAALPLARSLDPRLVSDDLAGALRIALDDPRPGYAVRAQALLEPYRPSTVDRVVADELLPRLLG